jgi:uncharacterized protein (TIGR00730 family)
MGGGRRRRFELGEPELDGLFEQLVARTQERYGESDGAEYVRQIVVTALRLLSEERSLGDLKLITSALKELRHAFRAFEPWAQRRKVSVFGSARTKPDDPAWQQAFRFARRMTEHGWMTITGAGDGIMGAAQAGAGREASFGVNIRLPFEQQANPVIAGDPKLINFRYFFTRKVMFVKESHAVALFPGGYGTHDEGFEALTLVQTGKAQMMPIVCVDAPGGSYWKDWAAWIDERLRDGGLIGADDLRLFHVTDDVDDAVREVVGFYANYHSSRFVGDRFVIRLRRAPDAETLARLNDEFADLRVGGPMELLPRALRQEAGEFEEFPRLVLGLDRRAAGRLRALIDRLNELVPAPEPPLEAAPPEVIAGRLTPEQEREEEEG